MKHETRNTKHETRNTKHETRNTKHETRWSPFRVLLTLAVTALSSFSAQAGDWPATADALMLAKPEISFNAEVMMTRMQITQMILNTKKQEYRAFGQSNVAVRCKTSTISDPVKLSEYEIEITAPKGGACDARVITIDLKAKKIVFIAYDGDRTNVKETYTVYKANFE